MRYVRLNPPVGVASLEQRLQRSRIILLRQQMKGWVDGEQRSQKGILTRCPLAGVFVHNSIRRLHAESLLKNHLLWQDSTYRIAMSLKREVSEM